MKPDSVQLPQDDTSRLADPKSFLLHRALRDIPKILTLQDRTPHSPTYGCFDRNYWHYKIIDFPSGMAQEFVLPLALAWKLDAPGNRFAGQPVLCEWVRAGIAFAEKSAHADGSCDDYFPFEKAAGATAFSLYAMLRAIELCELNAAPFRPFLIRRGKWLASHKESGQLSNHEALIANCLLRLAALTRDASFARCGEKRLARLMTWRSDEGWFREYHGADPGYLTLTIAMLAEIEQMRPDLGLREPIADAVRFLMAIQPPDGWLGGEWSSRNTQNYFPHGFELCGEWLPKALTVNDRAIRALADGPEYGDDHVIAHHCWSYFLTAFAWRKERPAQAAPPAEGRRHFPEAGLIFDRRGNRTALVSTKKGGAFRTYAGGRLIHSDTGLSLLIGKGRRKHTAVCHLWAEDNMIELSDDAVEISGRMQWAKNQKMTPFKLIVLRLLMLSVGRFKPDLVRRILQAILITGRNDAPFTFRRRIEWREGKLAVEDTITGSDWSAVEAAGNGPAQTSIYTVMSRIWHPSQLQGWTDLTASIPTDGGNRLSLKRIF